jgi:hypothetical protein
MKTRLEPRLPEMSKNNKLHTLDLNSEPLHQSKYFDTGPPRLNAYYSHKAVDSQIPVEGTNLPHQ